MCVREAHRAGDGDPRMWLRESRRRKSLSPFRDNLRSPADDQVYRSNYSRRAARRKAAWLFACESVNVTCCCRRWFALLKFVPTVHRAQRAHQLHIEGAVQRPSVEKHDAGGAFVPACPTFDFDDAAEDTALGIAGPRIRDACL